MASSASVDIRDAAGPAAAPPSAGSRPPRPVWWTRVIAGQSTRRPPRSSVSRSSSAASPAGSMNSRSSAASASYPVVPAHAQCRGQRLVALDDLLHHHVPVVDQRGQVVQVAAGIGEAVGVVDPQPVDPAARRPSA